MRARRGLFVDRAINKVPLARREWVYACASLALCVFIVFAHRVSVHLEEVARRTEQEQLSAGATTDLAPEHALRAQGPAAPARGPVSAGQSPYAAAAVLPDWVQTVRSTSLLAAPGGGERLTLLPQWQFLRVRGAEHGVFLVEVADGHAVGAVGWVEIADVGLSGPPPEWVRTTRETPLYASPDGEDTVAALAAGVDLMVSQEAAGQRIFVYQPQSPNSRRSGYGWVPLDAIGPVPPPPDVALPSPSLRAVPVAGPGVYRVQPGDSVASISAAVGVPPEDLIRLNGLTATPTLRVGQVVRVPKVGVAPAAEAPGPRQVRATSPGWISAEHAVVLDGDSGQILWAREAHTPVAPASLTKILTALVTLDYANLSDRVRVRVDSRRMPDSTVMGLSPGEELTVEDLLYGLMLPSGNDAALALAEHVAGTRERFVELMNEKVRSLGLTDSHFVNPHGLDATGHYSSAYDMAVLAREGMRHPVFRELAMARRYTTANGKGYEIGNLNQLLWRYPGADGVKIGYTPAAGRTIVGSAVRNGHRLYVALMRSSDIYRDSVVLLDWAFDAFAWP